MAIIYIIIIIAIVTTGVEICGKTTKTCKQKKPLPKLAHECAVVHKVAIKQSLNAAFVLTSTGASGFTSMKLGVPSCIIAYLTWARGKGARCWFLLMSFRAYNCHLMVAVCLPLMRTVLRFASLARSKEIFRWEDFHNERKEVIVRKRKEVIVRITLVCMDPSVGKL